MICYNNDFRMKIIHNEKNIKTLVLIDNKKKSF